MSEESPAVRLIEQRRLALYQQVGTAISHFGMIETQLLILFAKCLSWPLDDAARLVAPIRNFSTQMDLIDIAVRRVVEPKKGLRYWTSLVDYLRELSNDRNFLAHSPVIAYGAGTGPEAIGHMVGPSVSTILMGEKPKIPAMPLEEVEKLVMDFRHAVNLLTDLLEALDGSLPDKFSQPVVRLRPPRGIRLADGP